ncbi:hypothetical protein L2E82_49880 [Cichorium intybus]|uniref:Uncharacterized protein n=1 Tax=Cichorium intybus TaxID=13427 RepID=A0ACB8Z141_CICIN|nr:hypothetical protein L2E82_49880 [Cichorium intybus]
MKEVSVGTKPLRLQTFSLTNTTHVFVASDSANVIYSSNKKLFYSNVNLEEVGHMCPFSSVAFPNSLAFVEENTLSVGTIGEDFQRLNVRSIYFSEQLTCIAQQEKSKTFAICSNSTVHLLDDHTFETLHTYQLADGELGYSIVSCSFSGDEEEYYCVGTNQGRVLVFVVNGRRLELAGCERYYHCGIHTLNVYKGRLFAVLSDKLLLLKWMLCNDGIRKLNILT